ncbi:hypothetical protein RND71_033387 [Anisodus tanguticus]|uniref:Uncharacterized protein n=1 Tax=Anisodus tanguticus TaxID=243964 RepID=A0AAE1UW41_9SOLA|nr:hypothetical protein RND71_033387 [Anisodus tanguticus]
MKLPIFLWKVNIIEMARDFATNYLMESLKKRMDQNVAEQVSHALEMPVHWRMERLEARWFVEVYHKKENMDPLRLELAKLDYNMVQATYLEETNVKVKDIQDTVLNTEVV